MEKFCTKPEQAYVDVLVQTCSMALSEKVDVPLMNLPTSRHSNVVLPRMLGLGNLKRPHPKGCFT